jgi:hypothetical protein
MTSDDRVQRLKQALAPQDETACEACLSQLADYVSVQCSGEDYVAHYSTVAAHLDSCLNCASAYARLYELELAARADELPSLDRLPEPDLGFLLPVADEPAPASVLRHRLQLEAWREKLREALQRVGARITLQLSADLLPLLRPAPATAATRAPADAGRFSEVLLQLDPAELPGVNNPIGLAAYRDAEHPAECLIEVRVILPDRSWPDLGGIPVALIVAGERREATTDAWGLASWEGVPIARLSELQVEVILASPESAS